MIIAAYAGCGKSTFAQMHKSALDFHCLPYKYYLYGDSDRSEACKANPDNDMRHDWPDNYVAALKDIVNNYEYVLIPSDFWVLELLQEERIEYTLVYPCKEAREEYRCRYLDRGNTEYFLSIFYENWGWFIDRLEADDYGKHIVLRPHQFLADVL